MTTIRQVFGLKTDRAGQVNETYPAGSLRFQWAFIALAVWFLGGIFLDGWAHTHGRVDDSFFTPWHAVLYSGHLAVTTWLAVNAARHHAQGYPWRRALPEGYGLSLVGGLLFGVGGIADLIWHEIFGIERNVEALLSPSHLVLAISGFLIVGGPLRAAWRVSRTSRQGLDQSLPMLLSLTFTLSLLTFFTQFAHPLANLWGIHGGQRLGAGFNGWEPELGVASILLETGLLMGAILLIGRRGLLRPGDLTLIFTVNAFAMGFLYDAGPYPLAQVIARVAAGLVADGLLYRLQSSIHQPGTLRLFAFAVPIIVYGFYFLAAQLTAGISWSIHMWLGSMLLAGIAGLLLSIIATSSPAPDAESL